MTHDEFIQWLESIADTIGHQFGEHVEDYDVYNEEFVNACVALTQLHQVLDTDDFLAMAGWLDRLAPALRNAVIEAMEKE